MAAAAVVLNEGTVLGAINNSSYVLLLLSLLMHHSLERMALTFQEQNFRGRRKWQICAGAKPDAPPSYRMPELQPLRP